MVSWCSNVLLDNPQTKFKAIVLLHHPIPLVSHCYWDSMRSSSYCNYCNVFSLYGFKVYYCVHVHRKGTLICLGIKTFNRNIFNKLISNFLECNRMMHLRQMLFKSIDKHLNRLKVAAHITNEQGVVISDPCVIYIILTSFTPKLTMYRKRKTGTCVPK